MILEGRDCTPDGNYSKLLEKTTGAMDCPCKRDAPQKGTHANVIAVTGQLSTAC